MAVAVGPFELDTPLARGASGEVWRAHHRRLGHAVALKVIRGPRAAEPKFRIALRHEVRALARLSHPGIAAVIDQGEVPVEAEQASEGRLVAGSPWLAMELIEGGSLHGKEGRVAWDGARRIASNLLDALAHAHARGVLHRDLKPANVLLQSNSTWGVVLTDFGIAHPLAGGAPAGATIAGTPGFMAPEQREGRWRDFGPWTDLVGLGRTLLALLTGAPAGGDRAVTVPAGFEEWLSHLLADDITRRFRCAADASAALDQLGPPDTTLALDGAGTPTDSATTYIYTSGDLPATDVDPVSTETTAPRLTTTDWSHERWREQRRPLDEAGMRLVGLREPPFVGRAEARAQLWEALAEAAQNGPVVVGLFGPSGVGKTRLARWLAEGAAESGAASSLWVPHGGSGAGAGLRGALARQLGFTLLPASETDARAEAVAAIWGIDDPDGAPTLAALFGADSQLGGADLDRALAQTLEWLARERPLVVVLDNADKGLDSLRVTVQLMGSGAPILVLCTLGSEPGQPFVDALPDARHLHVGPLPMAEHREMLTGMLKLDPALATRVTEATLGEPRRAVELLRTWVVEGRLAPGERGATVRDPNVALGRGADALLRSRVDRFAVRPEDGRILEACALLGASIQPEEHHGLCEALGVPVDAGWLDRAAESGMVVVARDGSWSLAEGQMRAVLHQRAKEAGRLGQLHQTRASLLLEGGDPADRGQAGVHFSEAGDPERALVLLDEGARWALNTGDSTRSEAWLGEWRRVAKAAPVSPDDARWGEIAILEILAQVAADRISGLEDRIDVLAADASRLGWPAVLAGAWWLRGRIAYLRGSPSEALQWLERGLAWGEAHEHGLICARCRCDIGRTHHHRGEHAAGRAALEAAWDDYTALDHPSGRNLVAGELAHLHLVAGDHDQARTWVDRAMQTAHDLGDPSTLGDAALIAGELARAEGQLERAEAHYREGIACYARRAAFENARTIELNIAVVQSQRESWFAALQTAERCVVAFGKTGRDALVGASHVVALAPCAGLGERTAWYRHAVRAESLLLRTGFVDRDLAQALDLAHAVATRAGWEDEASWAIELANQQWTAIGGRP